jgi:NDP-sugar pyrophosphorylase family protein
VMNGDLLTKANLPRLLEYHCDRRAAATMCVRKYDMQVPFGVVNLKDDEILNVDEKPVHEFFVNAGIYALDPAILDLVPKGVPLDMPDLFAHAREDGRRTVVFPVHEYWLDIGRMDDFQRANHDAAGEAP